MNVKRLAPVLGMIGFLSCIAAFGQPVQALAQDAITDGAEAAPLIPEQTAEGAPLNAAPELVPAVSDGSASGEPAEAMSLEEAPVDAPVAAPVPASAPQPLAADAAPVPLPEMGALQAPQPVLDRPSPEPGLASPAIPEQPAKEEFDENLFFDAEALVPEGELAKKGVPSKVNPRISPGSALVISTVEKGKNTKAAQLVAAERAAKLGRFESALEIYESLYSANKRDPNILFGRASTLQSLGRDEEAIATYEELLAIRPENIDAQINLHGLIGKRYPAVAAKALADLYQNHPDSTAIVSQLAVMKARIGHHEEALRYLGMAAGMEPHNAGHVFNMAVIADRAGDKKSAVQYYEEALEIDTLYGSNRSIPRDSVYERLAELR